MTNVSDKNQSSYRVPPYGMISFQKVFSLQPADGNAFSAGQNKLFIANGLHIAQIYQIRFVRHKKGRASAARGGKLLNPPWRGKDLFRENIAFLCAPGCSKFPKAEKAGVPSSSKTSMTRSCSSALTALSRASCRPISSMGLMEETKSADFISVREVPRCGVTAVLPGMYPGAVFFFAKSIPFSSPRRYP